MPVFVSECMCVCVVACGMLCVRIEGKMTAHDHINNVNIYTSLTKSYPNCKQGLILDYLSSQWSIITI